MKSIKAEIGKTKGKFPERFFIVKVYIPVENGSSMKISFFNGKTKTEAMKHAKKAMKTLDYKLKFV
jgi:hypothetical protein